MPKSQKKKLYFGYNRFPSDEYKCLEEGCVLGNRLPTYQEFTRHTKGHKSSKPEDQDSGFFTDLSGEVTNSPQLDQYGHNSTMYSSNIFNKNSQPGVCFLEGQLMRSHAMRQRFISFHDSARLGIDFQMLDKRDKLRVQCQSDGTCHASYQLVLFAADFNFSVQGNVDDFGEHCVRLPRRLVDEQLWSYRILVNL